MDLGYCVVFDHGEQGWEGLIVVVTSSSLDKAQKLVEILSGYPRTHERYNQEVFDLTRMYHQTRLGIISELELINLCQYSPEAVESIRIGQLVDYSVQVHRPLSTRTWINRKWQFVVKTLTEDMRKKSAKHRGQQTK